MTLEIPYSIGGRFFAAGRNHQPAEYTIDALQLYVSKKGDQTIVTGRAYSSTDRAFHNLGIVKII